MNRLRAGSVKWVNPFNNKLSQVSLRSEDVSAIVFWSKNPIPLLPYLDEFDAGGYRMIIHYTITGLPRPFEPHVPEVEDLVDCASTLSKRYGPDPILWRYDPILISSVTSPQYHLSRFKELCGKLEGAVKRCYFSYLVFYGKVLRNIDTLGSKTGIACYDLPRDDRVELANQLADIAGEHGIEMFSCCGDYLLGDKIKKAHCTDAELLSRLYPDKVGPLDEIPTRKECGCCRCTDIGAYDTCAHGCIYCYANSRAQVARWNYERHSPKSEMIVGGKGD